MRARTHTHTFVHTCLYKCLHAHPPSTVRHSAMWLSTRRPSTFHSHWVSNSLQMAAAKFSMLKLAARLKEQACWLATAYCLWTIYQCRPVRTWIDGVHSKDFGRNLSFSRQSAYIPMHIPVQMSTHMPMHRPTARTSIWKPDLSLLPPC